MVQIIQLVIATILLFVIFFGIGFIANMLLKTTWFPIVLFAAAVIVFVLLERGGESLWHSLQGYHWPDYLLAVGGLVGAVLSGSSIKALRKSGFRMF